MSLCDISNCIIIYEYFVMYKKLSCYTIQYIADQLIDYWLVKIPSLLTKRY